MRLPYVAICLALLTILPPAIAAAAPDASKQLKEYFDAEWEWSLKESPADRKSTRLNSSHRH